MIRGTTPTHTFTVPDTSLIKKVRITYEQYGEKVLEKTEADCTITSGSISVTLTQAESLMFKDTKNVFVQVKALTTSGKVLANLVQSIPVDRILCEEVLE